MPFQRTALRRLTVLLAVLVAGAATLALGLGRGAVAAETADPGFLFGCPEPEAPVGDSGVAGAKSAQLAPGSQVVVEWVRADGSQPAQPQTFPAVPLNTKVFVDTDGNGGPADGWAASVPQPAHDVFFQVNVHVLSWEPITGSPVMKGILDFLQAETSSVPAQAATGWLWGPVGVEIQIGRLPGAASASPMDVAVGIDLQFEYTDGTKSTYPLRVGFRREASAAPGWSFPALYSLGVGVNSNVVGADVTWIWGKADYPDLAEEAAPAGEAYIESGDDVEMSLAWTDHTPGEFGFADMQRCWPAPAGSLGTQPAEPFQYLVLGRSGGEATAPPDVSFGLKTGKGKGAGGHPELALGIDVTDLPAMMDARVLADQFRLHRHVVKDAKGLPLTAAPAPDVHFAYTDAEVPADPEGDPLHVEMEAESLSEWGVIGLTHQEDGAVAVADAAFCNGTGGIDSCLWGKGAPGDVEFRYQNYLPPGEGEAEALPAPPEKDRYVSYAERVTEGADHYRVAARLSGPEHVTFSRGTQAAPAQAFTVSSRTAEGIANPDVAVHVDVDEPPVSLSDAGDHLVAEGTIAALPPIVEGITYARDPDEGKALSLAYKASAPTALAARVSEKTFKPYALAGSETVVDFSAADVPTSFVLDMLAAPAVVGNRITWTAGAPTALTIEEAAFVDETYLPTATKKGLYLTGSVVDMPTVATIDTSGATAGAATVDARFCTGEWATPGCTPEAAAAAGLVTLTAQNFPPAENPGGLASPPEAERYVHYASAGTGPAPWRAGGRLAGVQHLALSSAPLSGTVTNDTTVALHTAPGAPNSDVVVAVDTAGNATATHATGTVARAPATLPAGIEVRLVGAAAGAVSVDAVEYEATAPVPVEAAVETSDSDGETRVDLAIGQDGAGNLPAQAKVILAGVGDHTTMAWSANAPANLVLDEVRTSSPAGDLYLAGEIQSLPTKATLDLDTAGDGAGNVDVRFCHGTWGTPGCDAATVDHAGAIGLRAQNHPLDTSPKNLPDPPATPRHVSYAAFSDGVGKWWRADGRLTGVGRMTTDSPAATPLVPTAAGVSVLTAAGDGIMNDDVGLALSAVSPTGHVKASGALAALPASVSVGLLALAPSDDLGVDTVLYKASSATHLDAAFEFATVGDQGTTSTVGGLAADVPTEFTLGVLSPTDSPDREIAWGASAPLPGLATSWQTTDTPADPALSPAVVRVDVVATGVPARATIDTLFWGDGSLRSADVRFCHGDWGSSGCQDTLGEATTVTATVRNHDPAAGWFSDELPTGTSPRVVFDEKADPEIPAAGTTVPQDEACEPPAPAQDAGAAPAPAQWRAQAVLHGVRHAGYAAAPRCLGALLGLDQLRLMAVALDTAPGANTDTYLRITQDGIQTTMADWGVPLTFLGERWLAEGTVPDLPSSVAVQLLSTSKLTGVDSGSLLRLDVDISEPMTLQAHFLKDVPGLRQVEGRVDVVPQLGDAPGTKAGWSLQFGIDAMCADVDYDLTTTAVDLHRGCLTWSARQPIRLHGGVLYSPGADRPQWHRLHTDALLPTHLVAHWRSNMSGLRHFVATPGCGDSDPSVVGAGEADPGGCAEIDATLRRLPKEAVLPQDPDDLLDDPGLPEPDGTALGVEDPAVLFPAFTPSPQDVTFRWLHDESWGVHARITGLHEVSYSRDFAAAAGAGAGAGAGERTDICLKAAPSTDKLTLGLYHQSFPGLELPFYADGVLSRRPAVVGLAVIDPADQLDPASQDAEPLIWASLAKCHPSLEADLPDPDEPQSAATKGVGLDLLVRGGDPGYLQELLAPGGPAGGPADRTPGRPAGIDGHVQVDSEALSTPPDPKNLLPGVPVRFAVDVTAWLTVPDHLVIDEVVVGDCTWDMPVVDYAACHTGVEFEPEATSEARLRVLSTIATFGRLVARVVLRNDKAGTSDVVSATLGKVPGSFEGSFRLVENRRLATTEVQAAFGGLAADAPNLGGATVEYFDSAHPAYKLGVADDAHRVPNYRVHVSKVGPHLAARAGLYRPEPPNYTPPPPEPPDGCAAKFRKGPDGEAGMGLDYLDAEIDAGYDADVDLAARVYHDGRAALSLRNGGGDFSADVDARVTRVQRSTSYSASAIGEDWDWFGWFQADFSACIDADVPLRLSTKDAEELRVSGEGLEWILARNKGAGETSLRIEEEHAGKKQTGAYFATHETSYDPPDMVTYWTDLYGGNYTGKYKPVNVVRKTTKIDSDEDSTFGPGWVWAYWLWPGDANGPDPNAPNVVSVDAKEYYLHEDEWWVSFLHENLFPGEEGEFEGVQFMVDVVFDAADLKKMRRRDDNDWIAGRPGEAFWHLAQGLGEAPNTVSDFTSPEFGAAGAPGAPGHAAGVPLCPTGVFASVLGTAPQPDAHTTLPDGTEVFLEAVYSCSGIPDYHTEWDAPENTKITRTGKFRLRGEFADGTTRYLHGNGGWYPDKNPGGPFETYGREWIATVSQEYEQGVWIGAMAFGFGLERKIEALPSGHVLVDVGFDIDPDSPRYTFVFDPSGNGGPTGKAAALWAHGDQAFSASGDAAMMAKKTTPLAVPAPGRPPVVAGSAHKFKDSCAGIPACFRKRWYFGDGTWAEGDAVSHTYALPGSYPGLLVYFDQDGVIWGARRLDVTVSPE